MRGYKQNIHRRSRCKTHKACRFQFGSREPAAYAPERSLYHTHTHPSKSDSCEMRWITIQRISYDLVWRSLAFWQYIITAAVWATPIGRRASRICRRQKGEQVKYTKKRICDGNESAFYGCNCICSGVDPPAHHGQIAVEYKQYFEIMISERDDGNGIVQNYYRNE